MRVAVAHEWLTNWAGSERVARELVTVGQASELVASIVDPSFTDRYFPDVPVRGLWPTHLPTATTHWSRFAIPMLTAWATASIEADLLLVSSHFAAHGATLRFRGPSVVYYHTPARMLWRPDIELGRLPAPLRTGVDKLVLPVLRRWDRHVGQHPTTMLANSTAVAERIAVAYGRKAEVLFPPVEIERWSSVPRRAPEHFLWAGRLVSYKRPDLAVEAARLSGQKLVIVGSGPERARLEPTAPPNVRFVGHVPDEQLRDLMSTAHALVFPGEEDFGIAPVEAMAAGVPVVAYGAGGVLDYVQSDVNGLLARDQTAAAIADIMGQSLTRDWDTETIRRSVQHLTVGAFREGLLRVIARSVEVGGGMAA